MKNLYLLSTNQPSRLGYLTKKGKEVFEDLRLFDKLMPNILDSDNQNIYITSDEIKEGDKWIYNIHWNEPQKIGEDWVLKILNESSNTFKIILTTDQDLIKGGVQAIDEEFLEWFVKNPSCEYVEVKVYYKKIGVETDANGYREMDILDEDYRITIPKEEPKKETLEEAAEKYSKITLNKGGLMSDKQVNGFIAGAKWQAEQLFKDDTVKTLETGLRLLFKKIEGMYNEEDLKEAFKSARTVYNYKGEWQEEFSDDMTSSKYESFEKWFEQFKRNN